MDKLAIDKFKNDIRFRHKIAHIETIPEKEAIYRDLINSNPKIVNYLKSKDIKLYKHQTTAYKKIQNGKNIIITTPTASGKTLAFNLPIMEKMIKDKDTTAMYIYPAKALSNDQLNVLKNLEKDLDLSIKPATYDGDTEKSKKYGIRQNSRIVLTNPYQIHHILSWHHQWKRFYSNLKYIVIDEAHYYKGIFGSNVALLVRRLKRIANFYGSSPQFILSSATLANPIELANKLVGEDFQLIDKDTSPSGEKDFIFYNPFYKNVKKAKSLNNKKNSNNAKNGDKNGNGNSNNSFNELLVEEALANESITNNNEGEKITEGLSIHQETEKIFLYLLLKDIQTLCFTVSRKIAEIIAMWAKKDMEQYKRPLANKITAYRAGYLARERREIEKGLKTREYLGVTCTNALELGINIGSLDAIIISGYPGTMISTWQQAGRAGRENQKSLVILLAFENQLDQYFMKNPDFFFDKPHENAIVDLNNKIINTSHLLCTANELPITKEEIEKTFNIDIEKIDKLVENKVLLKNKKEQYIYPDDRASFTHSLDQVSNDSFKVMANGKLLETMERSQVYREAHEGAVLINKGETYIVSSVDLQLKYVNVYKQAVEYHTIVLKDVDINVKSKIKNEKIGDFTVYFGELEVSEYLFKYKKMHFSKTLGTFNLDLPPLKFKTKGIWFTIPEEIKKILEDKYDESDVFVGGLHGVEHSLIGLYPLHVMCDRFDIGGLSTNYHEDTGEATIFIYDAYEGGIGICEKALDVFNKLVQSTKTLIDTCACETGCPSCIYSPKCGNENKPLHKDATSYILNYIDNETNCEEQKEVLKNNEKNIISNDIEINENYQSKYKLKEALNFLKERNYSFAKDILIDIIDKDKNNSDAWYLLGSILNEQGDPQGAMNFLKKSLVIDPSNENAHELISIIKNRI